MSFINQFTKSQIAFWECFYLEMFGIKIKTPILRQDLSESFTNCFVSGQITIEIIYQKCVELFNLQAVETNLFDGCVRNINRPVFSDYVISVSGLGIYDDDSKQEEFSEKQAIGPGFVGLTLFERLLIEVCELYRRERTGQDREKYLDRVDTRTICLNTVKNDKYLSVCYADVGLVIGLVEKELVQKGVINPEEVFRFPRVVKLTEV
jgi:hypothetical protein